MLSTMDYDTISVMSTQTISGTDIVPASVVEPTQMASAKESAIHALGETIKTLVNGVPAAFKGENGRLTALASVDKWVNAHVPHSARMAVMTGDEHAPVEDVRDRVPPPQVTFGTPVNPTVQGAPIDYDRLAAAIVRQQEQAKAEADARAAAARQASKPADKEPDKTPVITDVPAKPGKGSASS